MSDPRIAFVSREVYPFDSAGLGNYVAFAAAALAGDAEVTIFTTRAHEERYHELRAAADPRLPTGVRFEFVDEPYGPEVDYWYTALQLWSSLALEALARAYPDGGPDLVEFPDYLGEGCATAQALQTLDPRLRNTTLCIRAYTTAEMCAVLDGFVGDDRDTRLVCELERYALRHADRFLWPGGGVLATYQRFYGRGSIAEPVQVPHVVPETAMAEPQAPADGAVRFLYVGRLERRKGAQNLIRAASALQGDAWSLTVIGGDTDTAPLGTSMRRQLDLMAAEDSRIRMLGRVPYEELGAHYREAHVCVSPSLWECWPNTVLEAFGHDRPVLATPVGGHLGMIESGTSGWFVADTSSEALTEGMEALIASRNDATDLESIPEGGPHRRFRELTDPEPMRERYLELAAVERPAPRPAGCGGAARFDPDPVLPHGTVRRGDPRVRAGADVLVDRDDHRQRRLAARGGQGRLRPRRAVRGEARRAAELGPRIGAQLRRRAGEGPLRPSGRSRRRAAAELRRTLRSRARGTAGARIRDRVERLH
jgi:glycosyltransferase involved in cell wall biosynthesis